MLASPFLHQDDGHELFIVPRGDTPQRGNFAWSTRGFPLEFPELVLRNSDHVCHSHTWQTSLINVIVNSSRGKPKDLCGFLHRDVSLHARKIYTLIHGLSV